MIDFFHVDSMDTVDYEPIYRHLEHAVMVAMPGSGWFDLDRAITYFRERDLNFQTKPSADADCVITTQYHTGIELPEYRRSLTIRLMYSLTEKNFCHSRKASDPFDVVLCPGPYSQQLLARWNTRPIIVGFPKYDRFFRGECKRASLQQKFGLDPTRPTVIYLPTWSNHSSVDRFASVIRDMASSDDFNVVYKPHTITVRFERKRIECFRPEIEEGQMVCLERQMGLDELFGVADLVLSDGISGAFWESIVVANLPTIALHTEGEFSKANLETRVEEFAPVCNDPHRLLSIIDRALGRADPVLQEKRSKLADEVLSYHDGHAGDRAAQVILELIDEDRHHPWRVFYREIEWQRRKILGGDRVHPWSRRLRQPFHTLRNGVIRLLKSAPVTNIRSCLRDDSTRIDLHSSYRAALKWIEDNGVDEAGIRVCSNREELYPEVTGYCVPSLLNCGEHDRAIQFAHWLLSVQNPDGSWSDSSGETSYTFDTGQILKGLLAILPRLPEVEEAILHGCEWLLAQIDPNGRVTTPDKSAWGLPGGKLVSENIHLYALESLRNAGEFFNEPRYMQAVECALAYYLAQPELTRFNTLSHFHAYVLEALVDLGYPDVAARGMAEVERLQRKDGSVPAYPNVDWVCSTGLAQYAVIWYKLERREPANRALDYLCRIQNPSGGFYGSYGRGANYFTNEEISWAVKFFLDTYHWHIRTAFDAEVALFPDTIEDSDGRFQTVLKRLGNLSALRVLDAGCGKGRFAQALLAKYPTAEIWGVDISDEMLRHVPPEVKTRQGSLMNLPFTDCYFDHAFCVEALEHAMNPEAAISELCRVVKPGGRIVTVDKNAECQGVLEIETWERWFQQSEVAAWLRQYCTAVRSEFIPYDNKSEPDGLFIAWQGIRRA